MQLLHTSALAILLTTSLHALAGLSDWDEGSNTVGCAWAKDIPGAKFVPGQGAPTVNLDVYQDQQGKTKITTMIDDHHTYFAVAKKGRYVKLKMDRDGRAMGWVREEQLFFGPLRNCH